MLSLFRFSNPVSHRGSIGRRGFTAIELLVVIGIIVLLASLTLVIAKVLERTKSTSVKVTFQTLNSALAMAEQGGQYRRQPSGLWGYRSGNPPFAWTTPVPAKVDFWKKPEPVSAATSTDATEAGAILAPEVVVESSRTGGASTNWIYHPAIANTGVALAILRNNNDIAKILEALPDNTARLPRFWNSKTQYAQGALVIHHNTGVGDPNDGLRVYEAVTANNNSEPGTGSNWTPSYATVKDTFGNPIIFVPAAGLQVGKRHVTGRDYNPGDRVYTGSGVTLSYYTCRVKTSSAPPSVPAASDPWEIAKPIKSPDGKPFWASAGPDGDFGTAGDNIYSFDN